MFNVAVDSPSIYAVSDLPVTSAGCVATPWPGLEPEPGLKLGSQIQQEVVRDQMMGQRYIQNKNEHHLLWSHHQKHLFWAQASDLPGLSNHPRCAAGCRGMWGGGLQNDVQQTRVTFHPSYHLARPCKELNNWYLRCTKPTRFLGDSNLHVCRPVWHGRGTSVEERLVINNLRRCL